MSLAERSQPLIILGAACFGLVVGQAAGIAALAEALILPLLMLMLTGAFLHVPLRRLGEVRRHGSVAALSLAINFIWTPAAGLAVGLALPAPSASALAGADHAAGDAVHGLVSGVH
jgi:ACR3 family arsenite transporter